MEQEALARPTPSRPASVVALAASAGGLKAIGQVLFGLPPDFPAAVVVVQHRPPDPDRLLTNLLGSRTPLRVKEAEESDYLYAGTVFVAPPDRHLLVRPDWTLALSRSAKVNHFRPAADVLFKSLASSFKDRAVAVVLTGRLSDGSKGVLAVKAAGGKVIAQDPASAQEPDMPRAAIGTGAVELVLPLNEIAKALVSLVAATRRPAAPGPGSTS
jgi:two-component system chemotaxis response regulator CheB